MPQVLKYSWLFSIQCSLEYPTNKVCYVRRLRWILCPSLMPYPLSSKIKIEKISHISVVMWRCTISPVCLYLNHILHFLVALKSPLTLLKW
jgi:hypothetical protein